MGGNYKASHLRNTTVQGHELTRIIHERFCCNRRSTALAREASFVKRVAQDGMSVSVSSHARYASRGTRIRAVSQRTVMNNAGYGYKTTDYGVFAHRNPSSPWSVGEMRLRFAERMARGLLFQAPPRITLVPPDDGPVGFCDGLVL
jgi:hypothetical protein